MAVLGPASEIADLGAAGVGVGVGVGRGSGMGVGAIDAGEGDAGVVAAGRAAGRLVGGGTGDVVCRGWVRIVGCTFVGGFVDSRCPF